MGMSSTQNNIIDTVIITILLFELVNNSQGYVMFNTTQVSANKDQSFSRLIGFSHNKGRVIVGEYAGPRSTDLRGQTPTFEHHN